MFNLYLTDDYIKIPSKEYSFPEYEKLHKRISNIALRNPTGWVLLSDPYEIWLLTRYWPNKYMHIREGLFGFNKFTFYDKP